MKSSSPTTKVIAGQPESPETVLVGYVLRPHGLRGEVMVEVLTDRVDERFAPGATIGLVDPAGSRSAVRVKRAVATRSSLRVSFEGIEDRNAAEALRGGRLDVPRSEIPAAAPGSYYHFELVGCRCTDGREGELGEVSEVIDGPSGLLLEVARPDGGKLLLPFVESFLLRVDPGSRIIEWRLPEGLVEACASRS